VSELLGDVLRDAIDSLKELAPKLFMGVSPVESHLAHAYRKLGVRSRAGLAGAVGTLEV
jgi:DNA-binding CsgD family transcriptional regulator